MVIVFFTSVAFRLLNFMRTCDKNVIKRLLARGVTREQTVKEIARRLRELLVQEWLSNAGNYQHLVDPNVNYTSEVNSYYLVTLQQASETLCLSQLQMLSKSPSRW